MRSVVGTARADDPTRVLSVVFLVSYLALGLPAIAAGWALAHTGDVVTIARLLGLAVAGLAALTLAATRGRG